MVLGSDLTQGLLLLVYRFCLDRFKNNDTFHFSGVKNNPRTRVKIPFQYVVISDCFPGAKLDLLKEYDAVLIELYTL